MKAKIIKDFDFFVKLLLKEGLTYEDDEELENMKFWFDLYKNETLDVTLVEPVITPRMNRLPERYRFNFKGIYLHTHKDMIEIIE